MRNGKVNSNSIQHPVGLCQFKFKLICFNQIKNPESWILHWILPWCQHCSTGILNKVCSDEFFNLNGFSYVGQALTGKLLFQWPSPAGILEFPGGLDALTLTANPSSYPWMFSHDASSRRHFLLHSPSRNTNWARQASQNSIQLFHLFLSPILCQLCILVGKLSANNMTQDYCDTSW